MTLPELANGMAGERRFVLLHESDTVLVCAHPAAAGSTVWIDGAAFLLKSDVALGHKIARVPMQAGDKVLRYGVPIGSMLAPVRPGDHVHSHNLKSDYIPAHARGDRDSSEIRS
jgi:SAF domain